MALVAPDRLGTRRRRFAMNVRIEEAKEYGGELQFLRPALEAS